MNRPVVKVITGMRRVGKSCLLKLIMADLQDTGTPGANLLYLNKESLEFDFIRDHKDLNQFVTQKMTEIAGLKFIFLDEVQEIIGWEKAVASLLATGEYDIYLTGSNAHLLSSEIATLIAGRYIEIPVYTLSFQEFLVFQGEVPENKNNLFPTYLWAGGFPAIHYFELQETVVYQYVSAIYDTIVLKEVVKRHNIRNVSLLENITRYLFDNTGNLFTAKKVADFLKSQKLSVGVETVQNYIAHLVATFAVHKVSRYDIKGKRLLELHEKYYLGDLALRHALFGYREQDIGAMLENLVYLELRRRGYRVYIGSLDQREVDFIAEKDRSRIYVQAAYLLATPATIEREFSVLAAIPDNYPKYVISLDPIFSKDRDGIRWLNMIDFLLGEQV